MNTNECILDSNTDEVGVNVANKKGHITISTKLEFVYIGKM